MVLAMNQQRTFPNLHLIAVCLSFRANVVLMFVSSFETGFGLYSKI